MVGFRFGIERPMGQSAPYLLPFFQEGEGGGGEVGIAETFPDVLDGECRRVHHVVSIEAIVPQFVHHDFIRREVMAEIEFLANLVGGQQQIGFAELVSVQAVFQVPYGTYRKQAL